jgi:alpha-amylase/alpha-mannosidase (GH57 family)
MSSIVIHGHFYQPPREDPFLDEASAIARSWRRE